MDTGWRLAQHPATSPFPVAQEIPMKRIARCLMLAAALSGAAAAHAAGPSEELSMLSALPVAVSVAAPVALLAGGAMLTVAAVEASTEGTVWVLERASDGARASLTIGSQAAGAASVAVGASVTAVAFSAGWLLTSAGRAIAFIPNEAGRALLYHERVTR